MAAKNSDLFGRYVWLIDTIRSHGRITFAEISEQWVNSGLGYGDPVAVAHVYEPQEGDCRCVQYLY